MGKVLNAKDSNGDEVVLLTNVEAVNFDIDLSVGGSLAIQPLVETVTGTTGGTVKLQESVNGQDFEDVAGATLAMTDGAAPIWEVYPAASKIYRINFSASGTHTTNVSAKYISKQ